MSGTATQIEPGALGQTRHAKRLSLACVELERSTQRKKLALTRPGPMRIVEVEFLGQDCNRFIP